MPPIQWVKLRQNIMALSSDSTSVSMLEPVVVNPDTVSKNASKKFGIWPLMIKGRLPKRLSMIHERPVMTKPSRAYILLPAGLMSIRRPPARAVRQAVPAKMSAEERSPHISPTAAGKSISPASTSIIIPTVRSTIFIFIIFIYLRIMDRSVSCPMVVAIITWSPGSIVSFPRAIMTFPLRSIAQTSTPSRI